MSLLATSASINNEMWVCRNECGVMFFSISYFLEVSQKTDKYDRSFFCASEISNFFCFFMRHNEFIGIGLPIFSIKKVPKHPLNPVSYTIIHASAVYNKAWKLIPSFKEAPFTSC